MPPVRVVAVLSFLVFVSAFAAGADPARVGRESVASVLSVPPATGITPAGVLITNEVLVEPLAQTRGVFSQAGPDVAISGARPYVIFSEAEDGVRGIFLGDRSSVGIAQFPGGSHAALAANLYSSAVVWDGIGVTIRRGAQTYQAALDPSAYRVWQNGAVSNGTTFGTVYLQDFLFLNWAFLVFDANGTIQNKVPIPVQDQHEIEIASAGRMKNGYIVVWMDHRICRLATCPPALGPMLAIRFDGNGVPLDTQPIVIAAGEAIGGMPVIADYPQGAMLVWSRYDYSVGHYVLLATRINSDGIALDHTGADVGVQLPINGGPGTYDVAWDGRKFVIVTGVYEPDRRMSLVGFRGDDPSSMSQFAISTTGSLCGHGVYIDCFGASIAAIGGGRSVVVYSKPLNDRRYPGVQRIYTRTILGTPLENR